jgi:hypothetical protein
MTQNQVSKILVAGTLISAANRSAWGWLVANTVRPHSVLEKLNWVGRNLARTNFELDLHGASHTGGDLAPGAESPQCSIVQW